MVSSSFCKKAGITITPSANGHTARTANGASASVLGTASVPISIQLVLQLDDDTLVYWERRFNLTNCQVVDLGEESPRDLYISYSDWGFEWTNPSSPPPSAPLANLAYMVLRGASVFDTPRIPDARTPLEPLRVILEQDKPSEHPDASTPGDADILYAGSSGTGDMSDEDLRALLLQTIPPHKRDSFITSCFITEMIKRRKVFQPVDPKECSVTVDFVLIGEPRTVAFRVPANRKVPSTAMEEKFGDWFAREIATKVPWSTPSYGYAHIVPQAGGKFRVVINPVGLNDAIRSVESPYLPKNMIRAAQTAGRAKVGASLDLSEAFTTLKLGPKARELSTFVTQLGKIQFNNAYFGVKTFPSEFQNALYEHVILPTQDTVLHSILLSWIDDVIIGAIDDAHLLKTLIEFVDRLLAFGGRLSLSKCKFFITLLHWCGVEIDLTTNQWRVDPSRVSSMRDTPIPNDIKSLEHVLGMIRYYYWTVSSDKQLEQRGHLAKLSELNRPRAKLTETWTADHTSAMKSAIDNICKGDWLLVHDPNQPVYVSTDASGDNGFAVAAAQYDAHTGVMRPIANFSMGWLGSQLRGWTPQVKECYALRYAVTKIMPASFPYAQVITLCDNRNLASKHDSDDHRIVRWQLEISDAGAITRQWLPGDYNTIADHGSRAVRADESASPDADAAYNSYIYSISLEKGEIASENNTVVPGHLPIAKMTATIAEAQLHASDSERDNWASLPFYSSVSIAGRTLHLRERKLIIPSAALGIKATLLHLAHDDQCHYTGTSRTLYNLRDQAKVWWESIEQDTASYIKSCFRCAFAKARHSPSSNVGHLVPTIPPYVMHTIYVDLKGPMPEDTGYLLGAVEGLSKDTKLRYLPKANAKEVIEELQEVFSSFGSNPVVLRSDGGPPFNSTEYTTWCAEEGITPVLGAADHSQGQGTVETKFRGIASALIAIFGGKAPTGWFKDPTVLAKLERVIGNTYSSTLGGCPTWARTGLTPRTSLSTVNVDFTSIDYGERLLGLPGVDDNDIQEVIAQHHANIDRVHQRVSLAVSLAQALTKSRFDATRKGGDFKPSDWVLVHFGAPNRLMPHFRGPYKIYRVSDDNNFVWVTHYLTEEGATYGPYHVSRLLRFDFSRATAADIAAFELTEGTDLVKSVTAHRQLDNGSYEFQIEWASDPIPSWLGGFALRRVTKVLDYCKVHSLPTPGTGVRRTLSIPNRTSSRGRGRGHGRGYLTAALEKRE